MEKEIEYFELLRKEVASTFRKTFPYCTHPIEEWKGQEISDFQEELLRTVKGRISEKWFYTHIKSPGDKLPRIDMLNMLCAYAGYRNWNEFVNKKSGAVDGEEQIPAENKEPKPLKAGGKGRSTWITLATVVFVVVMLVVINFALQKKICHYQGCLVDITGTIPSGAGKIEIVVMRDNESPVVVECDSGGCFKIESAAQRIRFVVRSPYYSTDTITRVLDKPEISERIRVRSDDYALMIHYFSTSNLDDWKKRRMQLDDMILEDAKIYQVFEHSKGMELYNKDEFINRMTMPLKSLKNIEIIETNYVNGRIKALKFKLEGDHAH